MADYSEEQCGKRVVAQNGTVLGEVTAVENGSLQVRVGTDADPDVLSHLDWDGRTNQERHRLNDRYISTIRDDTIRLRI